MSNNDTMSILNKKKYLRQKNRSIIDYFMLECDTMNFLYHDIRDKDEIYKLAYKTVLIKIMFPLSIRKITVGDWQVLHKIYSSGKKKFGDKYSNSKFLSFVKKNRKDIYDKLTSNIENEKKDKYIIDRMKYDIERHRIITKNIIKNFAKLTKSKYSKYVKYMEENERVIKLDYPIIIKLLGIYLNNINGKNINISNILQQVKSSDISEYIKNLNDNLSIYAITYVKMIYNYVIKAGKFLFEKYKHIYKKRVKYDEDIDFMNNYSIVINCWYEIDVYNTSSITDKKYNSDIYYKIEYNKENLTAFLVKSNVVKAINFKSENKGGDSIETSDIFVKNMKNNDCDNIIRKMIEEIEMIVYEYKNNFSGVKSFEEYDIHKKNPEIAVYEFNEEKAKKYIIDSVENLNRIKNITEDKYTELEKRLYKTYGFKPCANEILNKLFEEMGYNDKNDFEKLSTKSGNEICRTHLFTYTDIRDNYGKIYYPENKRLDIKEVCFGNIEKLHLELIHPKYYYHMLIKKDENYVNDLQHYFSDPIHVSKDWKNHFDDKYDLYSYQKQCVFGLSADTIEFRKCHFLIFMGFRQLFHKKDGTLGNTVIDYYNYNLNKVVNYCASKRNNLFGIRYVNNGTLPWQKLRENPNYEKLFIDNLKNNGDYIFLGIVQKYINPNKIYKKDNTLQRFMFYDKFLNKIFTFDETCCPVPDNIIREPVTFTFMEILQFCSYLNMYGYMYNKNNNDVFFSKYNIFDKNQTYEEDVYSPLTREQFEKVLNDMRSNITPIKCFKYPPYKNVPSCVKNMIKKLRDIDNENSGKIDEYVSRDVYLENLCRPSHLYVAKYTDFNNDKCKITHHRTNPKNVYQNQAETYYDEGSSCVLKIVLDDNVSYYYNFKEKINNFYTRLYNIQKKYGDNTSNILLHGYEYELLNTYYTYGHTYNKYYTRSANEKELKYDTILDYKSINKNYPVFYEVLHKYNICDVFNENDIINVLEISKYSILDAFYNYIKSKKKNILNNISFNVLTPNVKIDDEFYKNMDKLKDLIEKIQYSVTDLYSSYESKQKYDFITIAVRHTKLYNRSPYWIQYDNKIKLFYLFTALMNLKKHGTIIMPFHWIRTNVQREIYYLFKHIFKKAELYISSCSYTLDSSAGYIIGIDYKNNIDNNKYAKILNNIKNVQDVEYIETDNFLKKYSDSIGPIIFDINKLNDNVDKKSYNKIINSFYRCEDNSAYENDLNNYFLTYYNMVLHSLDLINIYELSPQDEIYNKLLVCIEWAKTYGVKLRFSFNTILLNDDFVKYIKYNVSKIQEICLFNLSNDYSKYYNNTIDINHNNESLIKIKEYVKSNDMSIYNNYKSEFDIVKLIYDNLNIENISVNKKWLVIYEILNFYDVLGEITSKNVNMYVNGKDDDTVFTIKNAVNYYIHNYVTNFNVVNKKNKKEKKEYDILILCKKSVIDDKIINMIKKYKVNCMIRLRFPSDENTINNLCNLVTMYNYVHVHRSELETSNVFYLVLKEYNTNKKLHKDINVHKNINYVYNKIIDFLINQEITKLYIINRYDLISKDESIKSSFVELIQKIVYRYIYYYTKPRMLLTIGDAKI